MLSMAPNIVFVPNITQNAERKHRTQNTNTVHFRTQLNRLFCANEHTKLRGIHALIPSFNFRLGYMYIL